MISFDYLYNKYNRWVLLNSDEIEKLEINEDDYEKKLSIDLKSKVSFISSAGE